MKNLRGTGCAASVPENAERVLMSVIQRPKRSPAQCYLVQLARSQVRDDFIKLIFIRTKLPLLQRKGEKQNHPEALKSQHSPRCY